MLTLIFHSARYHFLFTERIKETKWWSQMTSHKLGPTGPWSTGSSYPDLGPLRSEQNCMTTRGICLIHIIHIFSNERSQVKFYQSSNFCTGSAFTGSPVRRPSTSFAVSSRSPSWPTTCPSSTPTTAGPSGTQTPSSRWFESFQYFPKEYFAL